MAKVTRVTNANIYDSEKNLIGRAEEIKLPDIVAMTTEHKGLGLPGKLKLPSGGLEPMEMSIKWANPFDAEIIKLHANIFKSRSIQVRSEISDFGSTGRQSQTGVVAFLTVDPLKPHSGGSFKQHENVEQESTYTVTAYKLVVGGETLFDIDIIGNKFVVAGVDTLAQTRANLGA